MPTVKFPKIATWAWGTSYFVLIIIYAIIYNNLPSGSFYQPYIKYEESFNEDKDFNSVPKFDQNGNELIKKSDKELIKNQLKNQIIENFKKLNKNDNFVKIRGWQLNIQEIEVQEIKTTIDSIIIELQITIKKKIKNEKYPDGLLNIVSDNLTVNYKIYNTYFSGNEKFSQYLISLDPNPLSIDTYTDEGNIEIDLSKLFLSGKVAPPLENNEELKNNEEKSFFLILNSKLNETLNSFWNAEQKGLSGTLPNQFGRMLYFSIITATTTGYGDIIPLTSSARAWVSSEAILGVIIIGCFLNSIGQKRNE